MLKLTKFRFHPKKITEPRDHTIPLENSTMPPHQRLHLTPNYTRHTAPLQNHTKTQNNTQQHTHIHTHTHTHTYTHTTPPPLPPKMSAIRYSRKTFWIELSSLTFLQMITVARLLFWLNWKTALWQIAHVFWKWRTRGQNQDQRRINYHHKNLTWKKKHPTP